MTDAVIASEGPGAPEQGRRGVHIEDQGPPDEYGRVAAIVRVDGEVALHMLYAAWPEHLVLFRTEWVDGAPDDAEARLVDVLLDLYPARLPPRLTHSAVTSLTTVRWYAASHLAPGLMLSGAWGERTLFYDPVGAFELTEDPEPRLEGMPAATVTVMHVTDVRALVEVREPTLDDVHRWLEEGDPLGRFAAVRRLVVDGRAGDDVVRAALYLGMLNENSGLRQFCSIHLGGYFPELRVRPDIEELEGLLADPFRVWSMFGRPVPPPEVFHRAQGRRNARYAIAWTLGNICWNEYAWGASSDAEREAGRVRARVEASVARFDAARDRWLYELALRDFDPEVRYGFGGAEPVDLLDFLRFSALRWGIVQRLGLRAVDRFYWLVSTCDGIVGRGPEEGQPWEPASAAAAVVHAPPPSDALPDVTEMPPWLYGQNHAEVVLPIEVVG